MIVIDTCNEAISSGTWERLSQSEEDLACICPLMIQARMAILDKTRTEGAVMKITNATLPTRWYHEERDSLYRTDVMDNDIYATFPKDIELAVKTQHDIIIVDVPGMKGENAETSSYNREQIIALVECVVEMYQGALQGLPKGSLRDPDPPEINMHTNIIGTEERYGGNRILTAAIMMAYCPNNIRLCLYTKGYFERRTDVP